MQSTLEFDEKSAAETLAAVDESMILDYIPGQPVKNTGKEQVRQRIARALFHEYGISLDALPEIAKAYEAFREKYPEPGS